MHIQERRWQFWFCCILLACFIILCSFNVDKALSVVDGPQPQQQRVALYNDGIAGWDDYLAAIAGWWAVQTIAENIRNWIYGEPFYENRFDIHGVLGAL
jgi:hypothetical protein